MANIPILLPGSIFAACAILSPAAGVSAAPPFPPAVAAALTEAKGNRSELEKVLRHYQAGPDHEKFEAACFLVRNMPGHAFMDMALFDAKGNEVPFNALPYPGLGEALRALAQLEKQHGALQPRPRRVVRDVETVSADYLIEDIDRAFRAWREKPWSKALAFDAFCEYILPYRANREPVERWRAACEIDTRTVLAEMKDPADPREAAAVVMKHTKHRVGFSDLYYLHPTDQGFAELCAKPVGRCGDMANMQVYLYRANGIAVAGDYTPYWANRDNNHGWEVILDANGRGSAGLFNKAAKVYRKMFSHNPANLYFQRQGDEPLPPWLANRSYRDVTDQYMPTTDLAVPMEYAPPRPTRFAYLCVFNGGEWRPIHWGRVKDGKATFEKMGRGIAYLPAYYLGEERLIPAGPPFILDGSGKRRPLNANGGRLESTRVLGLTPAIKDDDLKKELPARGVERGKKYQLFVWDQGWRLLGSVAGELPNASWEKLPAGGLYWLVGEDDRETARIFTVEAGKQRFW